nr:cytosine permease [uncultured Agathobacter sp.]
MKKEKMNDSEFTQSSVPASQKKNFWEICVVWIGYVFVVTGMQVGGTMGTSTDFATLLKALAVGSVVLLVLGTFMGLIALKTGNTFGMLCRYAFGKIGSNVISLMIVVTLIGWFSVDAYMIGQASNALFPALPIIPIAIVAGIAMTATALFGMKWMSKLSDIAVPLVLIFGIISIVLSVKSTGGLTGLFAIQPKNPSSFNTLVSLSIGSFVCGAVSFTPDVLRFAKNKKQTLIIMFLAMMIANPLMIILGAVGSIATGYSDITFVLAAQGLLAPAFIVMILNIWSTAQGCVYSGSLSLANTFRIDRKVLVIGFGLAGTIGAVIGFYNYFGTFINFLATTIPALGGVFIADYLVKYRKGYPSLDGDDIPAVNWGAFIAWGLGIATNYVHVGITQVNCIIVAAVIEAVFAVISAKASEVKKTSSVGMQNA